MTNDIVEITEGQKKITHVNACGSDNQSIPGHHTCINQGTYVAKLFHVELGLQQYRSVSDSREFGLIWMNFVGMLEKMSFNEIS